MEKQKVAGRPMLPIKERKAIRAVEGAQAMSDYLAAEEHTRRNTERLRQIRLSQNK